MPLDLKMPASEIFHCDPVTFILSSNRNIYKEKALEIFQILRLLLKNRNSVNLLIWGDMMALLRMLYGGRNTHLDDGLENELKKLFFQSAKVIGILEYGSHLCEGEIKPTEVDFSQKVFIDYQNLKDEWEHFLASPDLEFEQINYPIFSSQIDGVIKNDALSIAITCPDTAAEKDRIFPTLRNCNSIISELSLIDPDILDKLQVKNDPIFSWEKTGHGATNLQKRIIERIAHGSRIVKWCGSIYQNPSVPNRPPSISVTDAKEKFMYEIYDKNNVIRGYFITNASSEVESVTALRVLQAELHQIT